MKPGDKVWEVGDTVWFLYGYEIKKGIFNDKFYPRSNHPYPNSISVDVITKELVGGKVETRYHAIPPDFLFPTREALCEHYRKIFE